MPLPEASILSEPSQGLDSFTELIQTLKSSGLIDAANEISGPIASVVRVEHVFPTLKKRFNAMDPLLYFFIHAGTIRAVVQGRCCRSVTIAKSSRRRDRDRDRE